MAFSDIGRFFDARGNLKRLDQLALEDRAAIASIEEKVSVQVKTLATILTEQELLLIRERLLEHSRQSAESGTFSKPEKENSRDS